MKKQEFYQSEIVNHNLTELYSCMKVCYGKDIDGSVLQEWLWKNRKEECLKSMLKDFLGMQKISEIGKHLNENFNRYFKIIVR